ncbi:MAG: hypothetical protein ACRCZ0_09745 [Cetobacterium sp.]
MMDRPYCLQELRDLESELHDKYRLSNIFAQHYPCGHKYRVKKGGRKEQFILDTLPLEILNSLNDLKAIEKCNVDGLLDDQTCSVCFKLRTSIESNKPTASFIDNIKIRDTDSKIDDIEFLKQKTIFYKWLFQHDY